MLLAQAQQLENHCPKASPNLEGFENQASVPLGFLDSVTPLSQLGSDPLPPWVWGSY